MNIYCLEYSPEQRALHIEPLSVAVERNRRLFIGDAASLPDYVIIHVGSNEECERMAEVAQMNINMEAAVALWSN